MKKVHILKGVAIAFFVIAILLALVPILNLDYSPDNDSATENPDINDTEVVKPPIEPPTVLFELNYSKTYNDIQSELLEICDSSSTNFNNICKSQIEALVSDYIPLDYVSDFENCSDMVSEKEQEDCIMAYLYKDDSLCDSVEENLLVNDLRFLPLKSINVVEMFPWVRVDDKKFIHDALEESNPNICGCIDNSRPFLKSECQNMASHDFDIWIARSRVDMTKDNIKFCNNLITVFNLNKSDHIVTECIKYVAFMNTDTTICEDYYGETERGLECAMRVLLHIPEELPGHGFVLSPDCDKTENNAYKVECEKRLPDYELLDESVNYISNEYNPWADFVDISTVSECNSIYSSNETAHNLDKVQQCYLYLAEENFDKDICKNIISPFVLGRCYRAIAESTDDYSICDELKSSISRNLCAGYISMTFP